MKATEVMNGLYKSTPGNFVYHALRSSHHPGAEFYWLRVYAAPERCARLPQLRLKS